MKKHIVILILSLFFGFAGYGQHPPKTVMLVLGSDKTAIIEQRIKVALKFYKSTPVDKIIVSGGCGAHQSVICEASQMKALLVAGGVPQHIIYKEENSKTTAQNYVFSRILTDEDGARIIQKDDHLYVVSDHWHAIAVAARFRKYDGVDARFFIEGAIDPKATDMLDYAGIFNKYPDNNEFILRNTWPTPHAAYRQGSLKRYVFLDRVYSFDTQSSDTTVARLGEYWPALPDPWKAGVDALVHDPKTRELIFFKGQQIFVYPLETKKAPVGHALHEWIEDLPAAIKAVDAAFIQENQLYVFAKDKLIITGRKGNRFQVRQITSLKEWLPSWPYAWGDGDIAAADYDAQTQTVSLYKNREVLTFTIHQKSEDISPAPLRVKWQELTP